MNGHTPKRKGFITAKVQVTGFHRWPAAFGEVQFLSDMHRHTFTCEASVWVSHADRQVEFTMLKKEIEFHLEKFPEIYDGKDFDNMSCESLSQFIIDNLLYRGFNVRYVSFSEDGEFTGGIELETA